MNYGYFDDKNKEYVITRPDTPSPWMNYLGNGKFSGMISNNAGGLVFDSDPGSHRITKYNHSGVPMDRPGHYLYLRDMDSGEYWSASWQPVMRDMQEYECRHGMGYTTIKGKYADISSRVTYFIPDGKNYEVWKAAVRNDSDRPRTLRTFSYMEFSFYDAMTDMLQEWSRYFSDCYWKDGSIIYDPSNELSDYERQYTFMTSSLPAVGYECQRRAFLGDYRDESNPIGVERGSLTSTDVNADYVCGSICCEITLGPGEEKEFIYAIGDAPSVGAVPALANEATDLATAERDLAAVRAKWDRILARQQVSTPCPEMNTMLNVWHPYECRMTFNWSRFISYYERGVTRGFGFRDSMQDVLGAMYACPEECKERIKLLLGIQLSTGDARCVYFPSTGRAEGGGRSDDHLWSIFSVCTYIRETGDSAFIDEIVPFEDGGEATVREHLMRGLRFTREHVGDHGIPLFLGTDWNDSLSWISRKKRKAESTFVFFQAAHAAYELGLLFDALGETENKAWADEYYAWCRSVFAQLWDGGWFLRAFDDDGFKVGTDEDRENKIFLNPQSWAVLSRLPSQEQGEKAFDNVMKYLMCEFGICSHGPATSYRDFSKRAYFGLKSGVKENGGVFFHANTWAVIAETLLRRGDEAFEIYHASLPPVRNDKADQCLIEPYVYASAMLGKTHERFGAGSNSWLTGTASWMYLAATQYILGIRPDYNGVVIDPCTPSDWNGFDVRREVRGTMLEIHVGKAPNKNARVSRLVVDGQYIDGNVIPYSALAGKASVKVEAQY
jgi:glycosyltransferase 36